MSDVNPALKKYEDKLFPNNDDTATGDVQEDCSAIRVFVPLCGKTIDMAYLTSKVGQVVGVDGIEMALEQFASEQPELQIENKGVQNGFGRFVGKKITLLRGDFFELDEEKTSGRFETIFDRASMVAIKPELRESYIDVMGKLIAKGGAILLVVLERRGSEEAMKKGPPFSIPEDTVRDLYEGLEWVESITLLGQEDQLIRNPEDKERYADLDQLLETVYLIHAKA